MICFFFLIIQITIGTRRTQQNGGKSVTSWRRYPIASRAAQLSKFVQKSDKPVQTKVLEDVNFDMNGRIFLTYLIVYLRLRTHRVMRPNFKYNTSNNTQSII